MFVCFKNFVYTCAILPNYVKNLITKKEKKTRTFALKSKPQKCEFPPPSKYLLAVSMSTFSKQMSDVNTLISHNLSKIVMLTFCCVLLLLPNEKVEFLHYLS